MVSIFSLGGDFLNGTAMEAVILVRNVSRIILKKSQVKALHLGRCDWAAIGWSPQTWDAVAEQGAVGWNPDVAARSHFYIFRWSEM